MDYKYYINGKEVSKRQFQIQNYLYNPLWHYIIINNKITYQWGKFPGIKINKEKK